MITLLEKYEDKLYTGLILLLIAIQLLVGVFPILKSVLPDGWQTTSIFILLLLLLIRIGKISAEFEHMNTRLLNIRQLDNIDETYEAARKIVKNAKNYVRATYLTPGVPDSELEKYYQASLNVKVNDFKRIVVIDDEEKKSWVSEQYKLAKEKNLRFEMKYLKSKARLMDMLIVDDTNALIVFPQAERMEIGIWVKDKDLIQQLKTCFDYIYSQSRPISEVIQE